MAEPQMAGAVTVSYWSFLPILIATIAIIISWRGLYPSIDPREPPLKKPEIPIVGHIIGLARGHGGYFEYLDRKYNHLPAFTIPMVTQKVIILTHPNLVERAIRHKNLSFQPLIMQFAQRLMGYSDVMMSLMNTKPATPNGTSFMSESLAQTHESFTPGPNLWKMSELAMPDIARQITEVAGEGWEKLNIYTWLRDIFARSTALAMLGPNHPLGNDPKLMEDIWVFEDGTPALLMLPLPGLFARPAFLARHRLHNAFRSYFHQGQHTASSAPEFITSTAVLRRKWNVPIDDFARESFAMFTAGLINSVPALLWLVYYVFSDDVLITETREEVAKVVVRDGDEAVLDFGGITGKCPLLYSAYQEVLRIQGLQPGARVALADVVLPFSPGDGSPDREYLIPKGTLVQMPAGVLHKDTSVWGADALSFDARRFMKDDSRSAQERLQKKAYFPFGGGKHLCPGRHFAFLEILGTMVVLLLQYELEGSNGGRLKVPETTYRIGEAVAKPKGWGTEALEGRVRKRAGWEDVRWTFVFGS